MGSERLDARLAMAHHAAMHRAAYVAAIALPLLACQSQAANRAEQDALDRGVEKIMCAASDEDRQQAIIDLADAVETYQPSEPDDSASGAVSGAVDAFVDNGCPNASPSPSPSPSSGARPPS